MNPDDLGYFAATPVAVPTAPPVPAAPSPWAPPVRTGWAPPAPVWGGPVARPESESGVGGGEALLVTGLALLASLALMVGMRTPNAQSYDRALRQGLAYTLFFYLAVGVAVGSYVVVRKVNLVWHRGSVLFAFGLGLPVGIGGGALAVALNSAIRGHLSGDPGVELLVGGGGALRILLTLVVTSVLAPLVEETVFRAICAGSLTSKGAAAALWVSALAFAIWHMRPESLRYYALMGLLLGRLWQKRGLIASMTAHACFNGVLTVVAVVATSGAAGTYTSFGGAHFELPGGWHAARSASIAATYQGPAGASLAVAEVPTGRVVTTDEMIARLSNGNALLAFGASVAPATAQVVTVHGRDAVQVDLTVGGQPGHMLIVPSGASAYSFVMVTGGSPRAEHDWRDLEQSVDIGP